MILSIGPWEGSRKPRKRQKHSVGMYMRKSLSRRPRRDGPPPPPNLISTQWRRNLSRHTCKLYGLYTHLFILQFPIPSTTTNTAAAAAESHLSPMVEEFVPEYLNTVYTRSRCHQRSWTCCCAAWSSWKDRIAVPSATAKIIPSKNKGFHPARCVSPTRRQNDKMPDIQQHNRKGEQARYTILQHNKRNPSSSTTRPTTQLLPSSPSTSLHRPEKVRKPQIYVQVSIRTYPQGVSLTEVTNSQILALAQSTHDL
ncbi:hypothetical protein DFS34DRAFT_691975, partial [Phlyctochytrium arcticum]